MSLDPASLWHRPTPPDATAVGPTSLQLVLRAGRAQAKSVQVWCVDRYRPHEEAEPRPMALVGTGVAHDYWAATVTAPTRRLKYAFEVQPGEGQVAWLADSGPGRSRPTSGWFEVPYLADADLPNHPGWFAEAPVVQIFPERFANGSRQNDPRGTVAWACPPRPDSFHGGDLLGTIEHLDHIERLGAGCIYLTPVFASSSNHKYNTRDYYQIDPSFGTADDLRRLVREAHRRGIRVVLDAVFNHSGDDFFAFQDVVRRGAASPYAGWYRVHEYPVRSDGPPNYDAFADHVATMPKLMTHHPGCADYLIGVACHWIRDCDIDGWRLDVANEVDQAFWRRLRQAVRAAKRDAVLVGELMHRPHGWLSGDLFDSVMNYGWRDAVLAYLAGRLDASEFLAQLTDLRWSVPAPARPLLLNLLGSHDTPRIATVAGPLAPLAAVLLFALPGTPMIFTGDEVGLEGGPDPDCRRTMPWSEDGTGQALVPPADLARLELYQRLGRLRREQSWLAAADVRPMSAAPGDRLLALALDDGDRASGRHASRRCWLLTNPGAEPRQVPVRALGCDGRLVDVVAHGSFGPEDVIWLPAGSARWLWPEAVAGVAFDVKT